ncbi:MAG: hypothetical protein M0R77_05000 [Gammaproteobacteria bacterium]|nr:hypothetical protein [Gammaproteobacteria bacterium]
MNEINTGFTPTEWKVLVKSPLVVFLFVAASDGKVQPAEVTAFQQVLAGAQRYKSALLDRLLSELAPQFSMVLSEVLVRVQDAGRVLSETRDIVDARLPGEQALLFKQSLFYLGNQLARASAGPGELPERKAEALMTLARVLGLLPA